MIKRRQLVVTLKIKYELYISPLFIVPYGEQFSFTPHYNTILWAQPLKSGALRLHIFC
jgi:hypothetical protein